MKPDDDICRGAVTYKHRRPKQDPDNVNPKGGEQSTKQSTNDGARNIVSNASITNAESVNSSELSEH